MNPRRSSVLLVVLAFLTPPLVADDASSRAAPPIPFPPLEVVHVGDGEIHPFTASQNCGKPGEGGAAPYRFCYNSKIPADQLSVKPGQTMRIRLMNRLTGLDRDLLHGLRPRIVGGRHDPTIHAELIARSSKLTNLHTHGLHVAPGERSDNVMLEIPAGKENTYSIEVPKNHAPGTHWYHAHLHGSTALQVQGGMVGALIVEPGAPSHSLHPPGFKVEEWVMVLQTGVGWEPAGGRERARRTDFSGLLAQNTTDGLVAFINHLSGHRFYRLVEDLERLRVPVPPILVNGVENPYVEVGQAVQRLRIVNTGSDRDDFKRLWIEDEHGYSVPMYLGAFDGVNLTKLPRDATGRIFSYSASRKLTMGPGNRADVFFVPETSGTFVLRMEGDLGLRLKKEESEESESDEEAPDPGGDPEPDPEEAERISFHRPLLTFRVAAPDGSYTNREAFAHALDAHLQDLQQRIPAYRSGYVRPFGDDPPTVQRKIRFGIDGDLQDTLFVINGRNYNKTPGEKTTGPQLHGGHDFMPGHDDYLGKEACDGGRGPGGQEPWPLREGTEEEWIISNDSEVNHPFHVHVNPFWVVDITEQGIIDRNGKKVKAQISARANNPHDPRLNRWQDTIILPKFGSVTVRHRVSDFTGVYVIHCHILQHEDRGMMINVLAVPSQVTDPEAYFRKVMRRNDWINKEINAEEINAEEINTAIPHEQ